MSVFGRARSSTTLAGALAALLLAGCGGADPTKAGAEGGDPTGAAGPARPETPRGADPAAPSRADLEAYVASAERQMRSSGDPFNGVYSDVRIEPAYPSGIRYVYVFSDPVDAGATAEHLDSFAPTLRALFRTQIAPELEALGSAEPEATWAYLNADRSPIWERTFTTS